ncbi:proton channel OTOP3-like isoform X2 [Scleropages formosus]|uniref:proton channel OTOP3-like isoform X2 n=1 Tax=Scleropages formosus TaxID=113540 RepID=UPI0010FAAD20|nr:proton channel OTOP3-like isoform X2 [Scleropages formosus]
MKALHQNSEEVVADGSDQDALSEADEEVDDCVQGFSDATDDAAAEASPEEWIPEGRRLLSGLLGLNVVMLGAALVAAGAFNRQGLLHQEPQIFILVLMGLGVLWMLWYLLWARRQPGRPPDKDHHAGGMTVTVVLVIFSAFSLVLHIFRMGYFAMMAPCKPLAKVLLPFVELVFLGLQTYLLWAHSKDCIHKHKVLTRSGLMLILCSDLLLWLSAVTEDTVHMEIELERENQNFSSPENDAEDPDKEPDDVGQCWCSPSTACRVFRKGFEVLYPFNMEYYLMAGCMLYVMWKNVGRHVGPRSHAERNQKLTLRLLRRSGILLGPLAGLLVLLVGVATFILYQIWVGSDRRSEAFLLFYGYHLAVMPVMSICCLVGIVIYELEKRARELGHNPTRSLDVLLLLTAAVGRLLLSYFCLVAAMAVGSSDLQGSMELAYSIACLVELVFQNMFIIDGLHRHPKRKRAKGNRWLAEEENDLRDGGDGRTCRRWGAK